MSTVSATADPHGVTEISEHHGPTDKQFYGLFWILVVLTAIEVSTEWWDGWFGDGSRGIAVALLFVIMAVKFYLILELFMHGRFDHPLLKRTFYFGLTAAILLYGGALMSMNFYEDSGTTRFNNPPPVAPEICAEDEEC